MKTVLDILILLALTIGPTLVSQFGTQAIAAGESEGCCKIRKSLDDKVWDKETRRDFKRETCDKLNVKQDGDKLDDAKGYVWWDTKCK